MEGTVSSGNITVNITEGISADTFVKAPNYIFWSTIDGFLMVTILCGNILTICAVTQSRRLSAVISNRFILSLAASDLLVGLALPYHLAFYLNAGIGKYKWLCLLKFILIIMACSVSIWNLIAIAVDRYIAIIYPLHYARYVTHRMALSLLSVGWIIAIAIASTPWYWNTYSTATECEFNEVLPAWYTSGVITPTFSLVWVAMLLVYWRICREAAGHARRLREAAHSGAPSDWKSVQVALLILGCFTICWLPFMCVACARSLNIVSVSSPIVYKCAYGLAMANSGMNPIIYAWKNTSFRRAFGQLLRCQNPDAHDHRFSQHIQEQISTKNRQLNAMDTIRSQKFDCELKTNGINLNSTGSTKDSSKNDVLKDGQKSEIDVNTSNVSKEEGTIDLTNIAVDIHEHYERDSAYESNSNSLNLNKLSEPINLSEPATLDIQSNKRDYTCYGNRDIIFYDIDLCNKCNVIENLGYESDSVTVTKIGRPFEIIKI